jgi:hypothetical protein
MATYYQPAPPMTAEIAVLRDDGMLIPSNSGQLWTDYQTWLQTAGNTLQPHSAWTPPPPAPPPQGQHMPPGWPPPWPPQF